jgi:hypothetical protein
MRASEWQFLCAVHEQPKSCCAIDYCCHTLDWAANVVSDQKIFPSRFVILNDTHSKNVGLKNLVNVFRRLHRIFAHAWFQHRSVFWAVEGQSGLYVLFKTVCDLYDLLPAENYKLPPEAEGLEAQPAETEATKQAPTILQPTNAQQGTNSEENLQPPGRTTTRRHVRSSPSTGSAVTTVIEADEEETDAVTRGMNDMQLAEAPAGGEPEMADVPVMVDESAMDKSEQKSADAKDSQPEKPQESAPSNATVTVVGIEGADEEETKHETSVVEINPTEDASPDKPDATSSETAQTSVSEGDEKSEEQDKAETQGSSGPTESTESSESSTTQQTAASSA